MRQLFNSTVLLTLISIMPTVSIAGGADQPGVALGVYLGMGGAWSTLDNSVNIQTFSASGANPQQFIIDGNLKDSQSRLSPWVQVGYAEMIDDVWLWNLALQYKNLKYAQNTWLGQNQVRYATNATTMHEANVVASIQQELMLFLSFGGVVNNQIFSLGIGSAFYSLDDSVRHIGSNGGLVSEGKNTYLFGGGFQLGYDYYFAPTWFIQCNYTYLVLIESQFSNMVNRAYFDTGTPAGTANLILSREYSVTTQEVMFSINKVFEV